MARFYGAIGYGISEESAPGVWIQKITERKYFGDVVKDMNRVRDGENLNPNIVTDNRFSIVADPYAYENFHLMRYVEWNGTKWGIVSVEVQRPRLILTVGGIYNG